MVKENSLIEIQNLVDHWICELEGYKPKKSSILNSNLGEELADLLFSIICIANHYKVDLGKELNKTIDKYSKRDSKRFLDLE